MANPFEGGKSPDIRISKKWHKFYQSFCARGQSQVESCSLFRKYTNLYTLCATIGYFLGKKTPLDEKIETPFTLEQVDEKTEWPTLISIAWADTNKDIRIFMDSRQIIRICDEYAETGVQFLLESHPFNKVFVDNCLYNPEKIDLEFQAMLLVKELKDEFSKAIV